MSYNQSGWKPLYNELYRNSNTKKIFKNCEQECIYNSFRSHAKHHPVSLNFISQNVPCSYKTVQRNIPDMIARGLLIKEKNRKDGAAIYKAAPLDDLIASLQTSQQGGTQAVHPSQQGGTQAVQGGVPKLSRGGTQVVQGGYPSCPPKGHELGHDLGDNLVNDGERAHAREPETSQPDSTHESPPSCESKEPFDLVKFASSFTGGEEPPKKAPTNKGGQIRKSSKRHIESEDERDNCLVDCAQALRASYHDDKQLKKYKAHSIGIANHIHHSGYNFVLANQEYSTVLKVLVESWGFSLSDISNAVVRDVVESRHDAKRPFKHKQSAMALVELITRKVPRDTTVVRYRPKLEPAEVSSSGLL